MPRDQFRLWVDREFNREASNAYFKLIGVTTIELWIIFLKVCKGCVFLYWKAAYMASVLG